MVDLLIIGAGPGGYEAALFAANKGLKVVLIEKDKWGGVCLNEGCIPTKYLIHHASSHHSLSSLIKGKQDVVNTLKKDLLSSLQKANIELVTGSAEFIDSHTVVVNGTHYQAHHIIIATGSTPNKLTIPGGDHPLVLDSTKLLNYEGKKLDKVIVIGGGYIGLELTGIFLSLGSTVHIVETTDHLLGSMEPEVSKRLANLLGRQGVEIDFNTKVLAVTDNHSGVIVHTNTGQSITADLVVSAIGRHPNTDIKGIVDLGISFTSKGFVVNQYYQTSIPHIYAIGDCVGKLPLAHQASHEGHLVVEHILGVPKVAQKAIPLVVFTHPECASVGPTSSELELLGISYKSIKVPYRSNGKAVLMDEPDGFVKILVNQDGQLIAAHLIGDHATELVHQFALIIHSGLPLTHFHSMVFAHPTVSELVNSAIRQACELK